MRRSFRFRVGLALILTVLSTGCGAPPEPGSPAPAASSTAAAAPVSATIPAVKADTDVTYQLRNSASVSNAGWHDGTFGKVSVMARRDQSTSNRTPLLTGTVKLADGTTVECRQFRSTIWGSFENFEALDLRCTRELDIAAVRSVDVVSASGAAEQSRQQSPG